MVFSRFMPLEPGGPMLYEIPGFVFYGDTGLNCYPDIIYDLGVREYTLHIQVNDFCGNYVRLNMTVVFTDIPESTNLNDPQLSPTSLEVDRNAFELDGGMADVDVATLTGSDADGDNVTSVTLAENPGTALAPFIVVPTGTTSTFTLRLLGSLTLAPSPVTLTLDVVDDGEPPRTAAVNLTVNIQEGPTIVKPATGESPTGVPEDTGPGQPVYTFISTDEDTPLADLVYSMDPSQSATLPFVIVGDELRTKSNATTVSDLLDREAQGAVTSYNITMTVSDGAASDTATLQLSITDVNDNAPAFLRNNYSAVIHENTAAGTPVLTVSAADADVTTANNVITYSITGTNSAEFDINNSTGEIIVTEDTVLNYKRVSSYALEIVATDSGTPALSATVPATITIKASPVFISPSADERPTEVPENTAPGAVVYTFTTTDKDTLLSQLSYAMDYAHSFASPFEIVGNEVKTKAGITADVLDREAIGSVTSYNITVMVSDGWYTDIASLLLSITDVNDNAPTFSSSNYSATVNENVDTYTPVLTVSATDDDVTSTNNVVTYSLANVTNSSHFVIDKYSGEITVARPSMLNYSTVTSYDLVIQAADSGDPPLVSDVVAVITIEASPVLVNPAADETPTDVPEDTAAGATVYTFISTDKDTFVDDLVYTLGEQSPATPSLFEIVGNTLQTKAGLTVDDLDREAPGMVMAYSISVTVSDGKYNDTTSLLLSITDVNDNAPMFSSSNYSAAINENVEAWTPVFEVDATDDDVTTANNVITYTLTGTDSTHFAIDGSKGRVTVATPSMLNYAEVSSYVLDIVATDGGTPALSTTVPATITIETSPVIVSPAAWEGPADVPETRAAGETVYTFMSADKDTPVANLVYTMDAQSPASPALFEIVGNELKLKAAPVIVSPAAWEGPADVPETRAAGETVYTFISTDKDTPVANLVYTMDAQSPASPALFEIVGNELKLKAGITADVLDREATGTVTSYGIIVTVSDGKYTDTARLHLSITDVNDNAPVFDADSYSIAISENTAAGTFVFGVNATDVDVETANNVIIYSIAGTNSDHFAINGLTGEVYVATPSWFNYTTVWSYTRDIVATDSGTPARSATVPATIIILATPVLERPVGGENATEIEEVTAAGELVYSFEASDRDTPTADLTYTIQSQHPASPEPFKIVNDTLVTRAGLSAGVLDQDVTGAVGTYTLTVRVSDGSSWDEGTVVINILDTNDESPVFTETTYTLHIGENATGIIGTVVASDNDIKPENNVVTYNITGGNEEDLFAMDSASGALSLTGRVKQQIYRLTVTATDGGDPANSVITNVVVNVDADVVGECAANPCENGATCRPNVNYYWCDCVAGWNGTDCDINIDDCTANPCQNSGTCIDGVASYTCDCQPGWGGENCAIACTAHMYGANCAHSCSCNDSHVPTTAATHEQKCDIVTGACVCSASWTGSSCDDDAAECGQNGAHGTNLCTAANTACQDTFGSYQCVCETGYTPGASNVCVQDMSDNNPLKLPSSAVYAAKIRGSKTAIVVITTDVTDCSYYLPDPDVYGAIKFSLETQLRDLGIVVIVYNIRCGSLIFNVFIETENTPEAAEKLSRKLQELRDNSTLTVDNQSTAVQDMTVNHNEVPAGNGMCSIYESISPCGAKSTCQVEDGTPVCRKVKDENPSDVILGVGIGVGVGGLLLIGLVIVCIVMAQRRKRLAKLPRKSSILSDRYKRSSSNDDRFGDRYPDHRSSSKSYAKHGPRMYDQMYDSKDVIMVPFRHSDDLY